jgi:hypothetical protein
MNYNVLGEKQVFFLSVLISDQWRWAVSRLSLSLSKTFKTHIVNLDLRKV